MDRQPVASGHAWLILVQRDRRDLWAFLQSRASGATHVCPILDTRTGERRVEPATAAAERRSGERRRALSPQDGAQLDALGYVVVPTRGARPTA